MVTGAGFAVWSAAVLFGLTLVFRFSGTAGASAHAPSEWPAESRVPLDRGRATLIMFVHPYCSCSRASLEELDRVLASAPGGLDPGTPGAVVREDAAGHPGVRILRDEDGFEARRFGARTSGQTLLYSAGGRLVFSGGITPARGHAGDSAGRDALLAYALRGEVTVRTSDVFGCALFASTEDPGSGA